MNSFLSFLFGLSVAVLAAGVFTPSAQALGQECSRTLAFDGSPIDSCEATGEVCVLNQGSTDKGTCQVSCDPTVSDACGNGFQCDLQYTFPNPTNPSESVERAARVSVASSVPAAPGGTTPGTTNGLQGSNGIQSARSTGYGTQALQGIGLYQGQPQTLLVTVVRQVFLFVGAILVVVIVASGIMFLTSAGSHTAVTRAKNLLLYGIIGAVVTFAAFIIAEFVIVVLAT